MSKLPNYLARAELQRSEWKIMRAVERQLASPEWCEWRDELRRLVAMEDGFDALPPEPPFGRAPQPADIETVEPEATYIDRCERADMEPDAAPEPEPEAAPEPPYVPDFTLIPDGLARFALADETAEDFRKRAFQLLFRFGIAEGENFEGGGEPLTPEEKITLLPMLIANFEAGNWLNLKEDLKPE